MSYQPIPNPLPVSGTVTTTPSGTQTVSGTVTANAGSGTFAVSGPLTDAQLRAAVVPVSLSSTTITGTVTVSGPLTDTQLRASAVPVSLASTTITGTVAVTDSGSSLTVDAPVATPVFVRLSDGAAAISTLPVSGPLTDTQLRATAVPVSLTSTTITGTVAATQSGSWAVSAAGPTASGTAKSGNPLQIGGVFNTTAPTVTTGQMVEAQFNARGSQFVVVGDGTSTAAIKAASTAAAATDPALVVAVSPNNTLPANITQINGVARLAGNGVTGTGSPRVTIASDNTPFTVNTTPTTPTASIINSAATTNATSVKASAGTLYSITASNVGAGAAFLKIYNLATAPTVGTSTIALTIPIAASGVVTVNFGSQGMRFGTGIALAITNLVADADATAVAAGQVKVLTSYI